MIRIVPDLEPRKPFTEQNFVRVHSFPKPRERSVTLAIIEHIFENPDSRGRVRPSWTFQTIVEAQPMSHQHAMDLAKEYAVENNVPVIYEYPDEGDFTDTVVMPEDTEISA